MLTRTLASLAFAALLAQPVWAGPWLREKGHVFLSFGENLALSDGARLPVHHDPHFYLEWGALETMTLGLSAFSGDAGRETTVEVTARMAVDLGLPEDHKLAASFGLGGRHIEGTDAIETLAIAGLSWGRGLENGWLAAEARIALRASDGGTEGKLDVTWGHRFSPRWTGMLQLSVGQGHTGDVYAKLAPTAILRVTDATQFTLGFTKGLTGDRGAGLSIGTWVEF